VLRAYQAAGRPKQSGKVMGSYGEWCRTVRDALLWLGEADPTVTCIPTNPDDPERQRFAAVVTAWNATIGTGRPVSAKEAGGIAIKASLSTDGKETRPELLDALQAVAAPMARANFAGIDPRRLSQWLGKKKGLVFSGLRFHPDDKSMHGRLWRLENVSRAGALDDDAS
jgi:putative DNA primase/helicase